MASPILWQFRASSFPGFYDAADDRPRATSPAHVWPVYDMWQLLPHVPAMWERFGPLFSAIALEMQVDAYALAAYCIFESYNASMKTFNTRMYDEAATGEIGAGIAATQAHLVAGKRVPGLDVSLDTNKYAAADELRNHPEYSIRFEADEFRRAYAATGDLARAFPQVALPAWGDPTTPRGSYGTQAEYVSRAFVLYNRFRSASTPIHGRIRALIAPTDWRDGTTWSGGFALVGASPTSPSSYLRGLGVGVFAYSVLLPDYQMGGRQASVKAILASAHRSASSVVTLVVNNTRYGSQQVDPIDPGAPGAQYQWLIPDTTFHPNAVNDIGFEVQADALLRNGLLVFNRIEAAFPEAGIQISIPFEEDDTAPQPIYDAWFLSQSVPAFMIADRDYPISIKMYNSGNQVWRPDGIRLRSENPTDNHIWGKNRVALPSAPHANPHSDIIFHFTVRSQMLGEQLFRWGMVREGHGPFGQKNDPVRVVVAKDALFVRQSAPATIVAGTNQPASVTFKNVSAVPWTSAGNFQLGSQGPDNNTVWGLHRVDLRDSVPPGGEVTFHFMITAPATAGKYNFQWQVLQEKGQVAWLGQPSPAFEVRVMPALIKAAVFVSQNVANPIHPGAAQVVGVTMRNVGTETWTAGAGFKLGSQNPTGNVRWGTNRVPVPHDVPPNAEVTFVFAITARDATGTWNFRWQMLRQQLLQEQVEWFGQQTPNIELHVAPQQAPRLDLGFVKIRNVTQGKVEVFTATSESRYAAGLSSGTRFVASNVDNGWLGMHRGDADIYFVKTKNAASGTVEVFTAKRTTGYMDGISATTRFHIADGANGTFGVLPRGDLYFIKTRNTASGTIEAFTALAPTYTIGLSTPTRFTAAEAANGWFGMLPTSDVYFIKTRNTASRRVEVFTATSASGYATGISAATRFASTDADNGTFGMLNNGDVYFVKTKNTASGKIEVFTARAPNYTSGLSAACRRFASTEGPNGAWGVV